MCYSNSSTSSNLQLGKLYQKKINDLPEFEPVYHINAFNFPNWRIISNEENIQLMHWGLVPHWFNGTNPETIASKTLNARIETIHEKASFKTLINRNRCIIPSSGFFEYQHLGSEKIPFYIKPTHDEVFSMAGLYDEWVDRSTGALKRSFTIITTEANELMAKIHNTKRRMPLMLSLTDVTAYLNPQHDLRQFSPIPHEEMNAFKIDKRIIQSPLSNVPDVQQAIVDNIGIQTQLF